MSLLERVLSYCEKIVNGEIKACKKHRWAVERFLRDYEECQNEDSLFYFDEEVLDDVYWFAHEFKHTEGILAGEPIKLTDFQLFIVVNIFCFKKKNIWL